MKLTLDAGVLRLYAGPRDTAMIRSIGGWSASRRQPGTWEATPSWSVLLATSSLFGTELEPSPEVLAWADRQIAREQYAAAVKAGGWAPEDPEAWEGGFGYQVLGGTFAADMERVIIGDEMGTGKTVQAALALRALTRRPDARDPWPLLVIAPNSMLYTWAEELEKWVPGITSVVLPRGKAKRVKALEGAREGNANGFPVAVIVNWEAVRTLGRLAAYGSIALSETEREEGPINSIPWGTVIMDEAHRLKDPAAKQTRAVWYVSHQAHYRWAMTGTPIANEPGDLWAIGHAIAPEEYPVRSTYINRYTFTGMNAYGSQESYAFNPATKPELDRFLQPRWIRRTLAETRPDVPRPLPPQVRWVDMPDKQAKAYEQMRKTMLAEVDGGLLAATNALTKLTRLLQFAAATPVIEDNTVTALQTPSCKIDALLELVEETGGEPLVVFTASRKLAELAEVELRRRHVETVSITGAVDPAVRKINVDTFQHGEAQVALVTLGAGSEGITLTAASTGVFLQRSFSMVQNVQAEGRLVRHGQTEQVRYIDVVTRGTAEVGVHDALARKEATLQDLAKDPHWVKRALGG